jgi:hypothetical protein
LVDGQTFVFDLLAHHDVPPCTTTSEVVSPLLRLVIRVIALMTGLGLTPRNQLLQKFLILA